MNIPANFTSTNESLEKYLLLKQEEIKKQLDSIENDDPVFLESVAESSELGTESWQADVHGKVTIIKQSLLKLLTSINIALKRLQNGTYGVCEKCGHRIDQERLHAMPTAVVCKKCLT